MLHVNIYEYTATCIFLPHQKKKELLSKESLNWGECWGGKHCISTINERITHKSCIPPLYGSRAITLEQNSKWPYYITRHPVYLFSLQVPSCFTINHIT